ncbi:probable leucine-rich repeat receptor-like protein kinase At5g49770 [Asparagus officinalis]|uniref:probable leucine-rich repeat receptor-like protein kinase At5g49770 n=1 Tax=Asparagus officinalis TaxID=4686 RepID=UPI00098E0B6C|nr:probable leucine-rich repeat receptor-like protein kinase At5g49770 [Asparagus officinalis]
MRLSIALVLLLLLCTVGFRVGSESIYSQDGAALRALMEHMKNIPPDWGKSGDPCGGNPWAGVTCNNSRVIELKLYNMGIEGTLSSDIGSLTELQILDLSYNRNLGGSLPPAIGRLQHLTSLFLIGCNFTGNIPDEIGNLSELTFLALQLNKFIGKIPNSLGRLSKLVLLDLAGNQLSGPIPISTDIAPGLDQLVYTKHFHFNKNHLSGPIPEKLFHSNLTVLHVLLDHNQLTGTIPGSIGVVQSLESLRLDNNNLTGQIPETISDLRNLKLLNLANNNLTGPMPNLTLLNSLDTLDLSQNSFDPSEAPAWFANLENLSSLVIESGGLFGKVPAKLFSLPRLQRVVLKNNAFNGSLDMGSDISNQLQIVNVENNALTSVELSVDYNNTIMLHGNPVCGNIHLSETSYCLPVRKKPVPSVNQSHCKSQACAQIYDCLHPYEGLMIFRAPYFQVVTDHLVFEQLEETVWNTYGSHVASVSLQDPHFNGDSYLEVLLKLCPLNGAYFNRTEILMELDLSNRHYKAPKIFGPYYFSALPYNFPGTSSSSHRGLIIGMVVGFTILIVGLVSMGIYAMRQKKMVQKAIEIINPFASWDPDVENSVEAPQLNGARWFSYDELKNCTNNFPEINVIGVGGYGKVYRGKLSNGKIVAIKREQLESNQGGLEFKTEIELLSRIHHKNLLELVGFCFQKGERMLIYEFMPNGTLRECLLGQNGVELNWKARLCIALDSARGVAYLHEHANPPIIHRDIKSTNILLDEHMNAKVADFGLSKLVSDSERGQYTTQVKGTLGYLDPEYYTTQLLTGKSDVYSFGVVMLELITAMPPIHNSKYIVREVQKSINKKDLKFYGLAELMDPVIRYGPHIIGFKGFVDLALRCVEDSSVDRPTMGEVVKELEVLAANEGMSRNSSSASSSSTRYLIPRRDGGNNPFEYSGGYSFSIELEPK